MHAGDEDGPDDPTIDRLPPVYARALRLREQHVAPGRIAELLEVEPAALAALFVIAEAKLAALRDEAAPDRAPRNPRELR